MRGPPPGGAKPLTGAEPAGIPWVVVQALVQLLTPQGETLRPWFGRMDEAGATGNLNTDARIAALAFEHGGTVFSCDRDFARFSHIRWINPLPGPMSEDHAKHPAPPVPKPTDEHPLANIVLNVVLPVLILSKFSHGPKAWVQMDPRQAMLIAVALPLGYGLWYFLKSRKFNFFSAIGTLGVLATGLLSLYLYNDDQTVKASAPQLFALKEAVIPLILAACVLGSHWTGSPLIRTFLYQPELFDIARIESRVAERGAQPGYRQALFAATLLFAASFLVSAGANYFLALHFLDGTQHSAVAFNEGVGKLTAWGFAVIAGPMLVGLLGILFYLRNRLAKVTGMHPGEILLIG